MTQLPLYETASDWRPPSLSELPSWSSAKRVGIDIETKDPQLTTLGPGVRRDGEVVGISFSIEDGPSHYLPIRHEGGDNLDEHQVWEYLRDQARIFTGIIAGANLGYDLDYLVHNGVDLRPKFFRDCQVAEPLIDDLQDNYNLEAICARHGIPGKDESLLRDAASSWKIDAKKDMWRLPARYVGAYAEADADRPLRLLRRQERLIDDQDLWQIYDLESRVLPILVKMRRRGVAVDLRRLQEVEDWSIQEERECLEAVYDATGVRIGIGEVEKKGPVAMALEHVGVKLEKTPTGQPKIDKNTLDRIEHPIGMKLARAKKMSKLRSTFADSIRRHVVGGRIHCTFNGLRAEREDGESKGALYGRLSSTDPNLQQQPSRDDFAALWRSIYVPDKRYWACNDYSQQEPRWLVHFAEVTNCAKAHEAAERYRNDPNTDNHQMMADMTGLPRKEAKIIYLGKCYEMGGRKFAHSLKLPTKMVHSRRKNKMVEVAGDEAQAILNQFDREAPFVKQLSRKCQDAVKSKGYIKTVLGRRCRFRWMEDWRKYDDQHKALNRLIQGSSADQTKQAMIDADEAGFELQLQVHDELDFSTDSREEAEMLAEVMRNCVPCNVPAKVDVELGPNWGDIS